MGGDTQKEGDTRSYDWTQALRSEGTPHSQSYAAVVQGWVSLCGEFETWQRGCRRDGTEQVEASVVPQPRQTALRDGRVTNSNRLTRKRNVCTSGLWQSSTILRNDRLDLKYATSCLASAFSSHSIGDMRAAKRVGRYLRRALVAWQGFPRPEELLCYMDC